MTETETKKMLKDIIDNGVEYECRPTAKSDLTFVKYYGWRLYKLGEKIHSDWEYRKKEKWYVFDYGDNDYRIFEDDVICAVPVFEGTKEECEKWIRGRAKTWLEHFFQLHVPNSEKLFTKGEINLYKTGVRQGITEFSKKILDELKNEKYYEGVLNLIKDLGVEI